VGLITIVDRWNRAKLYETEAGSVREAAQCAVRERASLRGADLSGADLSGATISWQSHALISQLLLREADADPADPWCVQRRAFAGLIASSPDWCWDVWVAMRVPYPRVTAWALDVLAAYVREDDDAPTVLRERAAELAAKTEAAE
jgi:hypothetical protein